MIGHDPKDQQLHENLQRIGTSLSLPDRPSEDQKDRWMNLLQEENDEGTGTDQARSKDRILRHRLFSIGIIGAAAASIVLVSSLMFVGPGVDVIQAATIFRKIDESFDLGVRVLLNDVLVRGVRINGALKAMGAPFRLEDMDAGDDDEHSGSLESGDSWSVHFALESLSGISHAQERGIEGWIYADFAVAFEDTEHVSYGPIAGRQVRVQGVLHQNAKWILMKGVEPLFGVADSDAQNSTAISRSDLTYVRVWDHGLLLNCDDSWKSKRISIRHDGFSKLFRMVSEVDAAVVEVDPATRNAVLRVTIAPSVIIPADWIQSEKQNPSMDLTITYDMDREIIESMVVENMDGIPGRIILEFGAQTVSADQLDYGPLVDDLSFTMMCDDLIDRRAEPLANLLTNTPARTEPVEPESP